MLEDMRLVLAIALVLLSGCQSSSKTAYRACREDLVAKNYPLAVTDCGRAVELAGGTNPVYNEAFTNALVLNMAEKNAASRDEAIRWLAASRKTDALRQQAEALQEQADVARREVRH